MSVGCASVLTPEPARRWGLISSRDGSPAAANVAELTKGAQRAEKDDFVLSVVIALNEVSLPAASLGSDWRPHSTHTSSARATDRIMPRAVAVEKWPERTADFRRWSKQLSGVAFRDHVCACVWAGASHSRSKAGCVGVTAFTQPPGPSCRQQPFRTPVIVMRSGCVTHRSYLVLIAICLATYRQWKAAFGGSQAAASLSLFPLFAGPSTASSTRSSSRRRAA